MTSKDEAAKAKAKSKVAYQGVLEIDYANGTITFNSGGIRVLRVTHLDTPVPKGMSVDMVAIRNVTSYSPLRVEHVESFQEWIDESIEPAGELGPE